MKPNAERDSAFGFDPRAIPLTPALSPSEGEREKLIANRTARSDQPRRGDMFIAKRIAQSAKPRMGGMFIAKRIALSLIHI